MYGFQADGLTSEHFSGWSQAANFQAARKAGYDTIRSRRPDLNVDWRLHVCLWAAEQAHAVMRRIAETMADYADALAKTCA